MVRTPTKARLREAHIELLRARAAIERQTLRNSFRHLGNDLQPSALLRSLLPASLGRKRPTDWLFQGLGLMKRYPFLVSAVSTVFSGARKKHRLLRMGAGLLISWQLARGLGARNDARPAQADREFS